MFGGVSSVAVLGLGIVSQTDLAAIPMSTFIEIRTKIQPYVG
jgi:hypothetical protein